MAKKAKIDIVTSGDTKGAKDVEKSLKGIEKQSIKTEKTTKKLDTSQGRLSATMKKQFPTFIKGGKAIKGMAGSLGSMLPAINPVTIGITAATAAIGFLVNAYKKWDESIKTTAARAAESFPPIVSKLEDVTEATDGAVTASENLLSAQDAATKAAVAASAARRQEISDLEAVTAAKIKAEKAEINLALAKGEITLKQAAEKKALLDSTAAQNEYQNKVNLAKSSLTDKEKALQASIKAEEELKKLEDAAQKSVDDLKGSGVKARAEDIGRGDLNKEVGATRGRQIEARNRRDEAANKINSPTGLFSTDGGYFGRKKAQKDLDEANKDLEEIDPKVLEAEKKRDEAVQAEFDRRKDTKSKISSDRQQAGSNVTAATASRDAAAGTLKRTQTTGKAILDANEKTRITEQKTRGVEAAASAAPAVKNSGQGPAAAVLAVVKQAAAATEANRIQDEEYNKLLLKAYADLNSSLILRESTKKQIQAQVREAMKASNKR